MMRARQHGGPCQVEGHGSRCEVSHERQARTRAQDKQGWRRGEFYEEDEPVEDIERAFAEGEPVITKEPN